MILITSRSMTCFYKYIIVLALNLFFASSAFSTVDTTTPPTATSAFGGNVGGFNYYHLATYDTAFDSLTFTPTSDFTIHIGEDIRISSLPYKIWANVSMGDSSLSSNITVNFNGYDAPDMSGHTRVLELGTLNLNNVNAVIDTGVTLSFMDSSNAINLENSAIRFEGAGAKASALAPFTITSMSGDNEFRNWNGQIHSQSTTIDVQSGSTLLFNLCGSLSPSSNNDRLYFYTPVTGTVNNATTTFNYSNVYFNSSSFNFTNNSTLALTGTNSKVEFEKVSFDTSQMTLGNNTTLTAAELTLTDATMTINSGARVNTNIAHVTGTTTLAGSINAGAGLYATIFNLNDNITFNQNGSRVTTTYFMLNSGSQLNVSGYGALFLANYIYGDGGTIDVTNQGEFVINRVFYSTPVPDATFNIDATSSLTINTSADLWKSPSLTINNSGYISVDGYLSGGGTISGTGQLFVTETGQISPGNTVIANSLIDTLTFENAVTFTNQGILGNQSQSQYYAHIDVIGGTPTNDLLQYDDNDFTTTGLTSIKVNTATPKTADELDGISFTIVSSLNAGSTGSLVTGGSYPTIIEESGIPALIDFTVSNASTNGNDDITLNATKQAYSSLLTHPSVNTQNQSNAASLLVNAANNGNTTVQSHLTNLQNSQVTSHFNTIHAEPYSSYMTVSLEQVDLVRNSVMSHASSTGKGVSQGKNYITEDKEGRNNLWMDVLRVDGDIDGDIDGENQLGGFDYKLTAFTIGKDILSTGNNTHGAYFSYGTQKMGEHDIATQDITGEAYHLGMYSYINNLENWNIRSVLGYSYGKHESKRYITLGNHSSEVDADYDSHAIYAGIKGGFTWIENKWITLSPEIGAGYSYYTQSSFKESGDPALGLKVDKTSAQSITTSVGMNAQFASLSDTIRLHPQAFVQYEHDWYANSNDKHEIDAALISNPGNKQQFVGQNRGEHAVIIGIGLASDVSSALQINGGFVYSKTNRGSELGMGISLKYKW